jgi:DNA-binding NtrC family response regulator
MPGRKIKLLIVDDEKDICAFVKMFFRKRGFLTYSALSGIQALSVIKKVKPHITLLDIHLKKGMDGMEVLKRAVAIAPDCRYVMITWDKTQAKIKQAKGLGVAAYLTKPLSTTQLLKVVDTVAHHSKGRSDNV